jgi:16S rRNA (guanine527-N7)-methyltransferase
MFRELLAAEFAPFGVLSDSQLSALERHYSLLEQWNQRMNLTRISDIEEVVRLHYCESLFLGMSLPPGNLRVADVGSGAGFPGFPVSVLRPECTVDLIESHHRKAVFLRQSCVNGDVRILAARAESLTEKYDWIISRAVNPVEVLGLNLAPNVAMLLNNNDAGSASRVIKVPWGLNHVIGLFHVEQ